MEEMFGINRSKNKKLGFELVVHKNFKEAEEDVKKFALKIFEEFRPETVLDCSCGTGSLVLALRKLGVKAYGIDSSVNVIENVRQEVKSFCKAGSITKDLSKIFLDSYDLVFCGNAMGYVDFEEYETAASNLSKISNYLILERLNRVNLNRDKNINYVNYYLIFSLFSKNGMYRNLNCSCNFKNYRFMVFQKLSPFKAILNYEEKLNYFEAKLKELSVNNKFLEKKVLSYSNGFVVWRKYGAQAIKSENRIKDLEIQIHALRMVERQYKEILKSKFWRLTFPFRLLLDGLKYILRFIFKCVKFFLKGLKSLFTLGPRATFYRVTKRKKRYDEAYIYLLFRKYFKKVMPTEYQLKIQKNRKFRKNIKFSVIVPLYNTPIKFLEEMVNSVINQTYSNWQLCLADGSEGEISEKIKDYCLNCASKDSRIIYKKLEENRGISENTNEALKLATGDYVAMLDHDDMLSPTALFEYAAVLEKEDADFLYSDELTFEDELMNIRFMNFKPDFSPDFLLTNNYICHLSVFSMELLKKVGFYNKEFDGSQDYDMVLRLSENAKKIVHIPKLLYYWRATSNSVAKGIEAKFYCIDAAKKAIANHLERVGLKAKVEETNFSSIYRIKYEIKGNPKISIMVANKDGLVFLNGCINSILDKSTYSNFEIIIIENNSCSETLDYYKVLEKKDSRIKVVYYNGEFNYSAINNFGVKYATGEYIMLLNNDTKIITPEWLEEMLMFAQRKDVGAVGAKLYYDDDSIQHAGVIVGLGGVAGHAHKFLKNNDPGFAFRAQTVQNLSAVTAACLLVRREIWNKVGGFDEAIKVAFNDVDFCLRIRKMGYLVVFTPHAELYHFESKSRGNDDTFEKRARFIYEIEFMKDRWEKELKKDPYYNPNLSLKSEHFLPDVV